MINWKIVASGWWFIWIVRWCTDLQTLKLLSSSCLSVRPSTTQLPLDGFSLHFISEHFWKFVEKIQVPLKSDMKTNKHFRSYLAHLFLEWEIFHANAVGRIKTHILCPVKFSRKSCRLWDNVEKYNTTRQATGNYSTAHAHCLLDN